MKTKRLRGLAALLAALTAAICLSMPVSAGWEQDESGWKYITAEKTLATGWRLIGSRWYLFDPAGQMLTGWQWYGGKWYYLEPSGAMCTGWVKVGEKWYLLDKDGAMQTGLAHDGSSWYFLDETGAWTEDDPESHTALSATGKEICLKDGIIWVDGILIANKSYPLPRDYGPGKIVDQADKAFQEMKSAMAAQGLSVWIASGYRSFAYQSGLYQRYVNRDGKAAADRYSARAGYSEHQTGLAFDVNQVSGRFTGSPEAKWLAQHAHEYGFIIRYPQGKENVTGYQYESWHLRYLGKEIATAVYNSGLCLEEYLGISSKYIR